MEGQNIQHIHRKRRLFVVIPILLASMTAALLTVLEDFNVPAVAPSQLSSTTSSTQTTLTSPAIEALKTLPVKGRAPSNEYSRDKFGNGWATSGTCDTRNRILARDMTNVVYETDSCIVESGVLQDPYTAKTIAFTRGASTSSLIQIDHVVALSDAWQKGAQLMSYEQRKQLANDPLELLAVDGPSNTQKSNGDAATWLPANKSFRCQYVARQIAIKQKYSLWVTQAEKNAIETILTTCPDQTLPTP
jgi:hypothetical protein